MNNISIEHFRMALSHLSEREQAIMVARFGVDYDKPYEEWEDKPINDVAEMFEKSPLYVEHIEAKLKRLLAHRLRD